MIKTAILIDNKLLEEDPDLSDEQFANLKKQIEEVTIILDKLQDTYRHQTGIEYKFFKIKGEL